MAKNATHANAQRTLACDAKTPAFNSGYLQFYDGAQPAGPDTAITTQNLLATLRFNATAFAGSVNGVATANAIVSDPSATGGANPATWYRCFKSDHTTPLHDGTVGTSGTNCVIASTTIVAGAVVSCSAFTLTEAAASAQ
jgi:hypothetical protein